MTRGKAGPAIRLGRRWERRARTGRRAWARGHGALGGMGAGALGGTGAGARSALANGRTTVGGTSGCAGVQGRAGCATTRQPCAATRPGGSATTRPGSPRHGHERAACGRRLGQLGQFWCSCTWLGLQPGF